ncbi:hypothetical protein [Kocuria rhizosphaericola]|uniref:hypothetical protein n=1 Tax=Kocuria rhizosphaericola TaxID=3376284 RepID=UPI0037A8C96E
MTDPVDHERIHEALERTRRTFHAHVSSAAPEALQRTGAFPAGWVGPVLPAVHHYHGGLPLRDGARRPPPAAARTRHG